MANATRGSTSTEEKKKITKEEEAKLTEHLYTQSIESRKKSLEAIEAKIYQTAPSKKLSKAEMEESAIRQATSEMEMRKKRNEELVKKIHKEEEPRTMSPEEIEASLRRMYDDPIRAKKANLETLNKKHSPPPSTGKKLSLEEQKSLGDRLCKPKKTTYTDEEINKVYGF